MVAVLLSGLGPIGAPAPSLIPEPVHAKQQEFDTSGVAVAGRKNASSPLQG